MVEHNVNSDYETFEESVGFFKVPPESLSTEAQDPLRVFPPETEQVFEDPDVDEGYFDTMPNGLLTDIKNAITKALDHTLFSPNNAITRTKFALEVVLYLNGLERSNEIADFRVCCDELNNPPSVIDACQFVADIYIKPKRSVNYIQLNTCVQRTGIEFGEIIEAGDES